MFTLAAENKEAHYEIAKNYLLDLSRHIWWNDGRLRIQRYIMAILARCGTHHYGAFLW